MERLGSIHHDGGGNGLGGSFLEKSQFYVGCTRVDSELAGCIERYQHRMYVS